MLPSGPSDPVGSLIAMISELYTQPADTPVQRFKCGITAALAWLGARVVRYSFPVRLFHSLLHAGLSRRYPDDNIVYATTTRSSRPPAGWVPLAQQDAGIAQRGEAWEDAANFAIAHLFGH